jgi:23S rRNA pseudouridine1911/1915/1917 synthase
MPPSHTLFVPDAACGERLDRFLGAAIPSVSRERIKKAVRNGGCLLDGRICAVASTRLAPGQRIDWNSRGAARPLFVLANSALAKQWY